MSSYRQQQNFALDAIQRIAARSALSMLQGTGLTLEDAARSSWKASLGELR